MENYPQTERAIPSDASWQIVQACRFIEKKGLPDTLQAFALFHAKFPMARLVLAGEGPLEDQLKNQIVKLGLGSAVSFAGFLDAPSLAALYSQSHIFIHPSVTTPSGDREGVPNSLLEAMATGLPVVATKHGGIPEAVNDGVEGVLVPEQAPKKLAEALLGLAGDPARWSRMSQISASQVRKSFEASRSIEALEGFYEELMRAKTTGPKK